MRRFLFRRQLRIRQSKEFACIYEGGIRKGDGFLLLFAAKNPSGSTRLGLSVSRKHGGAVIRNRIKRRLREAFRSCRHELPPGLDLIAIPRVNSGAGLKEYISSLIRLSRKLAERIESTG